VPGRIVPDENGEICAGRSAVEALMNRPRLWIFGQCRAKGRRARSVRLDGVVNLTGSQARMKVSRDGHLEASVSMFDWVISTGWSCDNVNSLNRINAY